MKACHRCARESGRTLPAEIIDRPCPACILDAAAAEEEGAVERYLAEKRGTTIRIDDNLCECASWTVAEARCFCGNRRIYIEARGGDIVVCAD